MSGTTGLFKSLLGIGFLSSVWNDFKNGVIDDEDEKNREKNKKAASKYAKAYTKNMDKEIRPGLTLRQALEAETKKRNMTVAKAKELENRLNSKIKI